VTQADLAAIVDLARWAPSGDNTQPWRFELAGPAHLVVHGFDTRAHCVYDIDGRPSQMSLGALLETAAIAATTQGLRTRIERRPDAPETAPVFDLHFSPADPASAPDPLAAQIRARSVQRRPYSTRPLDAAQRQALEAAVGAHHRVRWIDGAAGRRRMALLLFHSAKLRLITPEAYAVHRDVIEWGATHSADRIPDRSLGVDALTLRVMRFALQSWARVRFLNRWMAGTWAPRIQMDLLPGLACGAHFLIEAQRAPASIDDHVAAGRAMQRFWLTAAQLGLVMQPQITPLVFARYADAGRTFSTLPRALPLARRVSARLVQAWGERAVSHGVFMGRIGHGPRPQARSLRLEPAALAAGAAPLTQPRR
jgi:nitroreductase